MRRLPYQIPAEAQLNLRLQLRAVWAAAIFAATASLVCLSQAFAQESPVDPQMIEKGRYLTTAANCVGCHTEPNGVEYAGGRALKTPFGVFYSPNITPHPTAGIGRWSDADFLRALKHGISPQGRPYYPAFPYTSFSGISDTDALAIKSFLFSLPPSDKANRTHELSFPYSVRLALWPWRWLYFDPKPFAPPQGTSPEVARGAYLVNVLGHCGECHTPRNRFGAREDDKLLAGTIAGPEGGKIPNITPDPQTGLGHWSKKDVIRVLESGLLPNFDAVGSSMGEVVRATSKLEAADRAAIAAYLASIPPIANPKARATQPEF